MLLIAYVYYNPNPTELYTSHTNSLKLKEYALNVTMI